VRGHNVYMGASIVDDEKTGRVRADTRGGGGGRLIDALW